MTKEGWRLFQIQGIAYDYKTYNYNKVLKLIIEVICRLSIWARVKLKRKAGTSSHTGLYGIRRSSNFISRRIETTEGW
jgi:hypothetical protein